GAAARGTDLEHLRLDLELVARPDRPRPPQLLGPRADDAARRTQAALDEQPHREGRRVPAAGAEAREDGDPRRLLVEVERLRVVGRGEGLDRGGVDPDL